MSPRILLQDARPDGDYRAHPTAIIHEGAVLGDDAIVWAYAHVQNGSRLGRHVSIGGCTEIGRFCQIGERTRIGFGCFIPNRTTIGARVFIGPRVVMCDDKHPQVSNPTYRAQPPVIEDDVSIGAGAVILPSVRLGQGCRIGAGAVVTKDVEPYQAVVGNPARPVRASQGARA